METYIHGEMGFHGVAETKVTDSLQTQVPAELRRRFHVGAGDIVVWEADKQGRIIVSFRKRGLLSDLVGLAPGAGQGDAVAAKKRAQRGNR